jgi:hypothetical protein
VPVVGVVVARPARRVCGVPGPEVVGRRAFCVLSGAGGR